MRASLTLRNFVNGEKGLIRLRSQMVYAFLLTLVYNSKRLILDATLTNLDIFFELPSGDFRKTFNLQMVARSLFHTIMLLIR